MQQLQEAAADFAKAQIESGKTHALYLELKDAIEKPYLDQILIAHHGNQSAAALALGINRATLRKKLTRHGLM